MKKRKKKKTTSLRSLRGDHIRGVVRMFVLRVYFSFALACKSKIRAIGTRWSHRTIQFHRQVKITPDERENDGGNTRDSRTPSRYFVLDLTVKVIFARSALTFTVRNTSLQASKDHAGERIMME